MAKTYWLEWLREDDAMKGSSLPGGYTSLKEARLAAAHYVKVKHPIDIDGSNEFVAKIGKTAYVIVERDIWGNTGFKISTWVKIRILKDGSLSKAKLGMADVLKPGEKLC